MDEETIGVGSGGEVGLRGKRDCETIIVVQGMTGGGGGQVSQLKMGVVTHI